ncbi:UDP-glucose 4-epimerase GalE [Gulosibacter molinativorax]|uniref:UDP-glucose 4-epimerase n=1 Tax=Gulosibacter molinativorax TaxID=256821 RepID=A0ABT7C4B8_9MICO|nr:UDP-glucose 4-epimerase GalE [Gulosibacter molinativorax]MDJ1370060.1 UDP-glucose 4-epimerase GalE [Gulosibacter molinativorax]QUY63747.1 UDP-glucose 4-epimerase [Gulosibacter molinativorax]
MRVLLTGGAGYIGSHIAVVLLDAGHTVIVLDNFANSHPESLQRVQQITGKPVTLINADLADFAATSAALEDVDFDAAIHLAGLKAVGESVEHPTRYYRVNLTATLNLLDIMRAKDVRKLIFSSSATVYGVPQSENASIDEAHPVGVGVTNPYGWSKAWSEQMLRDAQVAWPELEVTLLRYFNPVGAHESGAIGEDPFGKPNNLMPFVAQVAVGRREQLHVFGDTHPTPDGTGVRDYIHVVDVAEGHVAALGHSSPGVQVFNLGSGSGNSVLEVVATYSKVSGRRIPFVIDPPRAGDLGTVIADPGKANRELGWRTKRTLEDACRDSWRWQDQNPDGFRTVRATGT